MLTATVKGYQSVSATVTPGQSRPEVQGANLSANVTQVHSVNAMSQAEILTAEHRRS